MSWFDRWVLEHSTTILRDIDTGKDPYGGRVVTADPPTSTAVACFLINRTGREAVAPDRVVVVEDVKLLLPLGTDITSKDRIGDVTDKRGTVLILGPLNVLDVLSHHDHLEATLERVS